MALTLKEQHKQYTLETAMKTRNTLIALAIAASALTGFTATASQAGHQAMPLGYHDRNDNRPDDSGGWNHRDNSQRDGQRGGRWDDRGGRQDHAFAIETRIRTMQERIQDGRRNGSLSRREAIRLDNRLDGIRASKRMYERSGYGLSRQEAATLNGRLDDLSGQLRSERHDHNDHNNRNRW